MTMPARSAASLNDYQPEKSVLGAVPQTALMARLDLVEEQLAAADCAAYELVRRLEPILPMGFGETARPDGRTPRTPENSQLAARLADIAGRAESLVLLVRGITESVDL